jgi:branched-chain amino acid transport system substrate-binding protein
MFLLFFALLQANSTDGQKIKDALENLTSRYDGVITRYSKPFSKIDHDAISQNMFIIGKLNSGRIDYAYHDDELEATIVRKKRAK